MKKRLYKQYLDNEEYLTGWQTVYCSLSLIMVVFFIMLVSYSVTDKRKMNNLKGTLSGKVASVGQIRNMKTSFGLKPSESLNAGVWINKILLSFNKAGVLTGLTNDVVAERYLGGIKIKFNSDVVFTEGSAVISKKIYPYLNEMSKIAKEQNLTLRIEGHTDNVPIHSIEFPSNWELSAARATNIIRYLIKEQEFPANRLAAEGFAQYRPLASNSSPEGRQKNRRIEVYLERGRD
jgi:chemotaxis protein MotB